MKASLLFVLFILGTFINDFEILGFPVFYIIWSILILVRAGIFPVKPIEILVQLGAFFIVLPSMLVELLSLQVYGNYYFFIVLYVNFIFLIPYFLDDAKKEVFYLSLFLILLFSLVSLFYIFFGDRRAVIGFGPNVLYRMYGMIYAFFVLSAINMNIRSRAAYLVATLLLLVCVAATGSRGGVVAVLVMVLLPVLFSVTKGLTGRLVPVYFLVFFALLFYLDMIVARFWRLFKFDVEGDSAGARFSYFSTGVEFFIHEADWFDRLVGITSVNGLWNNYPHNFILESLIYSGLYFCFFIAVSLAAVLVGLVRGSNRTGFYIYSSSFVGALLSGGLMNNFVVLSYLFSVMLMAIIGVRKVTWGGYFR